MPEKKIKIKEIAAMAGVSSGTVDRVLHNRGKVSPKSREAVETVLAKVGYQLHLHTSAIAYKKELQLAITIPTPGKGDYWNHIQDGISLALKEFSDFAIHPSYFFYNQFDLYSCIETFEGLLETEPDLVIIGPTFEEETRLLCAQLEERGVPYIMVVAPIDGIHPVATFATDQDSCGRLIGKVLCSNSPDGSPVAIFEISRIGNQTSSNSARRRKSFIEYVRQNGREVYEVSISILSPKENRATVLAFFKEHPDVKGIAILNSRGHIIADILQKNNIHGISINCFDLTEKNIRCLKEGSITTLLCQRPERQGYQAVVAGIKNALYNNAGVNGNVWMPIDLIMDENLPYYREFFDA